MLKGRSYGEIYNRFEWKIPKTFNVGVDICDRWAQDRQKIALIHVSPDEKEERYTFWELKKKSNQLANTLSAFGINKTDRVGILLPQCPETLISHIAIYKVGAIALPLLTLFGTMAIEYRLSDSGAKAVITDRKNLHKIIKIKDRLPNLKCIMAIDTPWEADVIDFWESVESGSDRFKPLTTRSDDPAIIIYTSGTTGQPKGTLHAHRLLLGILPGFEFYHNLFPKPGDLMYTPLDWAYIGGSYDALFPALHHGVSVLSYRSPKFDPEKTLYMMAKYGVRNLMAVPTVLRMMMHAVEKPEEKYDIHLRSITVGGEILGEELQQWSKKALKSEINEQYGQTECDLVIGFCSAVMSIVQGTIGKAVPGHRVGIIDESGGLVQPGELGEIAVKRPDPVMFLEYWNNPKATASKYIGDWLRTGDYAIKDNDGYFWFAGREDDIIESGGYRIGPGEIEACLMSLESVSYVCVLGVPDAVRGEVVKAFIVPKKGVQPDANLEKRIQEHVRENLEKHAYPRKIAFLEKMPMTKSGKIRKSDLRNMG